MLYFISPGLIQSTTMKWSKVKATMDLAKKKNITKRRKSTTNPKSMDVQAQVLTLILAMTTIIVAIINVITITDITRIQKEFTKSMSSPALVLEVADMKTDIDTIINTNTINIVTVIQRTKDHEETANN